ncbi:MAG: hypothetical protein EZS28_009219 [Streblomastix strix]|uniref:DNA replication complex GINS protein PSF3 N-terminal domain-containing protein n=1 Tax=Streblomastix strix TaxID=222440 RepID=A0A5J4WLJ9_9EUKA|nr:MAG: hypothetical protein EZS28_009219 [Streblomastix strix]
MISDYYSIDDILLSQELVPVTFDHDAARMNYLAQSQDLSKGTKVQVPLWLAQGFLFENQAKIGLPEYLEEKKQDSMIADPENFNLQQTPKYYEVGKLLVRLEYVVLQYQQKIFGNYKQNWHTITDVISRTHMANSKRKNSKKCSFKRQNKCSGG